MTPLNVCIDVSAAVHRRAGLGRYALELVRGLVTQHDATRLHLSAFYHQRGEAHLDPPLDQLDRVTTSLSVRPWRLSTALAYFTGAGMDGLFDQADIFHATEHLLPRLRHTRSVFTLHDLIFQFDPASHTRLNIAFLRLMMPRFLRRAGAIIAVSECSKRDAVNLYGVPADKIHVIYEGVDAHFQPVTDPDQLADVRARYRLPEHYLIHVGTIEPRKNLPLLFEVVARTHHHLVVAGRLGWLTDPIVAKVQELGIADRVTFTGFVPDVDLPAMISAADVLGMPSKYEGFGLPVLEGMACGTPVIAAKTSSLPEVGGEAALYASPNDPGRWVELIDRVVSQPPLRATLREAGLRQAAKFTWATMARETSQVYDAVAQRPSSAG